jgi:flagellar hook-associated protein 1 FlgK
MALEAALGIATGGLDAISRQLALVSHNVANASTPGYAREVTSAVAVSASGVGMGVRLAPAERVTDAELNANVMLQNGTVADLQTRQTALAAIDAIQGTPGQGNDLPSLLGGLQDAFSSLAGSPDSQPGQAQVVAAAQRLAAGINTLSNTYTVTRQGVQDAIVSGVDALNQTLSTIGNLTNRIKTTGAAGQSTADLENQRDQSLQDLSKLVGVKVLEQPDGGLLAITQAGLALPLDGGAKFTTSSATVAPGAYYPGGGIPGVTLGGVDVTAGLAGGSLGANITLRDQTLPADQAELDEFAQSLASRFDAQGLRLFTDGAGAVPASAGSPVQAGYVGFSGTIQVNAAIVATPSLVRDGTQAAAGSPTGSSAFAPNPSGGPAGFATLSTRVLDFTFGAEAQPGVPQPAINTAGLGAAGTLSAPYASPATLGDQATALVGAQSTDSAAASAQLQTEQAVQTSLQSKLSDIAGVNVDAEMSTMIALQNAYAANAKVIAAVQAVWSQLLNSMQ